MFACRIGSQLARSDETTRTAPTEGFNEMVAVLGRGIEGRQQRAVTLDEVFALVELVGAMKLSRVISDPKTSDAVLRTVKSHLGTDLRLT